MDQADILIVEDDLSLCEALNDTLSLAGYRVVSVHDGGEALRQMARRSFRLVISDVQMQNMDGMTLLEKIRSIYALPVILMTAYGTIQKAVQAIQAGACDYLVKPFEADALVAQVARFIEPEQRAVSARIAEDNNMKQLLALAAKVAKTDATVLIQGESGTGKEVVARYIHEHSARHGETFTAINCAAIPENMLEALLFGYEKGAFTGAYKATAGKFELAQGGTLLLDEISEMDLSLQAKLLRVLQESEVERLGGHKPIKLDVRILATTNRNLRELVRHGDFREDLFYRLNVFPLQIMPLRERKQDILALARHFIRRYTPTGKTLPSLDAVARQRLIDYVWPGNVRELENVIQRALILYNGEIIKAQDLAFEEDQPRLAANEVHEEPGAASNLGEGLRTIEEKIILETLREEQGSRKSTAERLGISPRTLRYKIARMREAGVPLPC